MNIFVTSYCPAISARSLCDRHISKMLLESCQLLGNHFDLPKFNPLPHLGPALYTPTHEGHPCNKWLLESPTLAIIRNKPFTANMLWLYLHARAILNEYQVRHGNQKRRQTLRKLYANQTSPIVIHKCAIPLQKLAYLIEESLGITYENTSQWKNLLYASCGQLYTPQPMAMPDEYKFTHSDPYTAVIHSYRNYYIQSKSRFAKWAYTRKPWWYTI